MRRILIFSLIFIAILISTTNAQVLPQDISISINPSEPKPGQQVSASVESFGMDLYNATITWKYNNTTIGVGTGKTSVNFVAPNSSSTNVLSVSATGPDGSASSSIIIRSSSVDLIWEATDSYTPAFYKGKALPSVGARLRVTAIPNITAPKTLSYRWQYNGDAITNQSGTNKNSLSIKTDVLSSTEGFSVVVNNGGFTGTGNIKIPLGDPNVVVYQKSNGFIDYSKGSLRDVFITVPGVTLRAEPFNFSIPNTTQNDISIGFKLGDQSFVGTTNNQELSITKPDNTGNSDMTINITSLKERLQQISKAFILHF